MKVHVLAGDCLAGDFRETGIDGDVIVARECLIDGPVDGASLDNFFEVRAGYLSSAYKKDKNFYFDNVVPEFKKLVDMSSDHEIYLWFEYELFCQVNMWFVLSLLESKNAKIFRVFPSVRNEDDKWKGFGSLSTGELGKCFEDRIAFSRDDLELGAKLWAAYQKQDLDALQILSNTGSKCFPYLKEVCEAEIERKQNQRPQRTLRKIAGEGVTEFGQIFQQFTSEEGVYGFGDMQVKAMYEGLKV